MKKAIFVIIFGLLWSNAGVAGIDKLERCYTYNAVGEEDYKVTFFQQKKFDEYRIKEAGFVINRDYKTVKYYWTNNDTYSFGFWFEDTSEGIVITKVGKDMPAKKAKLKKKDIIFELNGISVKSLEDYDNFMINYRSNTPGDPIEVKFKRKKKIKTKNIIPKLQPGSSTSEVYNIDYHDDVDVSAKHAQYPKYNTLKINLKNGNVIQTLVFSEYDTKIYYSRCENTTLSAKKAEPKKKKPKQGPDDNKVVAAASGSGFFVSNTGHIVTNHHVIDQCKVVKVNFKGNEIEAKVLAIDKTNDLAILKANITPDKVYSVSNEDVTLLQDIIVAGFPLGKKVSAAIKTHKGSVSALAGFGDNFSNFQTDATINQGNSGGPVMDQKGNIVGVAVALMPVESGQNIFFAVKSSTLKTFASSNGLSFLPPNNRPMTNKDLGQLITEGTVFLECWMTIAKIKQIIAQEENRKAFYSEHK